jgi:hypothetical protein
MGTRTGIKTRNRLTTLALIVAAPVALTTCQPADGTDDGFQALCAGYNPSTGQVGPAFDNTAAAGRKLNAIMQTSVSLVKAANEIHADAVNACKEMGGMLGVPAAELEPTPDQAMLPGAQAKAACSKVKAKIDEIIATLNPMVKFRLVATPAVCTISAEFHHNCVQMCEMKTITETELHCKPGKLSGHCSAMCTGSCSGTCMGSCKGSCSATCKGKCTGQVSAKCMGVCQGTCEGTCTAMNADGTCNGMCNGTCHGSCSAEIEGSCSGTCEGSCSASCSGSCTGMCMGSCTGGCSVMYQRPYCQEVEVMREVTECETSCETRARAEASCTEPKLELTVESNLEAEKMKAKNLVAALKVGLPRLLKIIQRAGGTIKASAESYQTSLSGLPSAIVGAGVQGARCVTAAATATGRAVGQISASVDVSISVNASVSGRAAAN